MYRKPVFTVHVQITPHSTKRSLAGLLIAKSARRRGEIAMQPFVAGQGHIQVDAFEPQVATVGGVAEKQLRGGCRKRLGERRRTGRFALEPSKLRRSVLFAGAFSTSRRGPYSPGTPSNFAPKNFAQNNISCRRASHLARSGGASFLSAAPHCRPQYPASAKTRIFSGCAKRQRGTCAQQAGGDGYPLGRGGGAQSRREQDTGRVTAINRIFAFYPVPYIR